MLKTVLLAALAALVAALAAWIITVNVYTSVMAFRHATASPAQAFRLGFETAGVAAIAVFAALAYALEARRNKSAR